MTQLYSLYRHDIMFLQEHSDSTPAVIDQTKTLLRTFAHGNGHGAHTTRIVS